MTRRGRKPLAADHVEHLTGSELAKLRLTMILQAMLGGITVAEACAQLGVCQSRFHVMRNRWLQESLELLEPRRVGRPPKQPCPAAMAEDLAMLEGENEELREQLVVSDVRRELAEILPHVLPSGKDDKPEKRGTPSPTKRRRRIPR